MPEYDFRALSPGDFELLTRDILNVHLGLALSAYAAGRDQGIDLRQIREDGVLTVVQCKHYLDSSWSTFKGAVKKEVPKGQALNADRYLFVTSRDLTPPQENDVIAMLKPLGVTQANVWARKKLNEALGAHPEIERRHIKLWLSSTGVLQTILGAGRWNRAEAMLDRALKRAKLWVRTDAYDEVLRVLEREGVCIVYGPPGVGKSFVAETALLAATAEGWSPIPISSDMRDAWEGLAPDSAKQIFYYDDFLGESQLQMSKNEPSDLADFIERIKSLREHKWFIMTTREQFIREAADKYDALQDLPEEVRQLGVRVGRPSVRTKAEILFNHLYFSGIPGAERDRMAIDNRIITIVEHAGYNPRLIERALKSWRSDVTNETTLEAIEQALDSPGRLWKTSFQNLDALSRRILLTMMTLPNRPSSLQRIRLLVAPTDALQWRPALRMLDSTWLSISGTGTEKYATLADPGCRDYLLSILDDGAVADDVVGRVQTIEQVVSLTHTAGLQAGSEGSTRAELAHSLAMRRDVLMELVRSAVAADDGEGNVLESMQLLQGAAAMTAIHGTDSDTESLIAHVAQIQATSDRLRSVGARGLFELAETLVGLATPDSSQRDAVAEGLVLEGVRVIDTMRDLDAYETLPEGMRTLEVQEAIGQSATRVLTDEIDHLLQDADDPESIRLGVADINKRSSWYGLDLDTSSLLDRANEIQEEADSESPWPEVQADSEGGYGEDDVVTVRQIFSRLNE